MRKSWKILGCLAHACPEIMHEVPDPLHPGSTKREPRPKSEIRDITHLHHALDACVMGYAALLLPNNGKLWQQLLTRKITRAEQPEFTRLHGSSPMLSLAPWNRESPGSGPLRLMLGDLPAAMKNQIATRLLERRVVQHVPADMSGARLEQLTWGVTVQENGDVVLHQRTFNPKDNDETTGARKRSLKVAKEKPGKLVGLQPGKLNRLKGALVISENYGVVVLDADKAASDEQRFVIVPFHQVRKRLLEAKRLNGGKPPLILRNGELIRIEGGTYPGVWRIFSVKNNTSGTALDMGWPDVTRLKNGVPGHKINVLLKSLLKAGLSKEPDTLTGSVTKA